MSRSIQLAHRLACAGFACALVGCAPSSQADPHQATPSTAGAKPAGAAMSSFNDALKKFTSEVAAAYGKRPAELQVTPPSEDIVGFDDENLGDLIAFQTVVGGARVRGFANKSAAVLAKKNDYAALFQAAHALDAAKSLPAPDIASRIVWMMGGANRLVANVTDYPTRPLPAQVTPPTIERTAAGAVLHFFYTEPGQPVGAPSSPFAAEVRVSADYKAQLTTHPGP